MEERAPYFTSKAHKLNTEVHEIVMGLCDHAIVWIPGVGMACAKCCRPENECDSTPDYLTWGGMEVVIARMKALEYDVSLHTDFNRTDIAPCRAEFYRTRQVEPTTADAETLPTAVALAAVAAGKNMGLRGDPNPKATP